MPSRIERERAATLLLLQDRGKIDRLRFHPRYDLKIDGIKVTTYVADAEYFDTERRKTVVEDTKPEKYMDDLAKLKIGLFNALNAKHGLSVSFHRA